MDILVSHYFKTGLLLTPEQVSALEKFDPFDLVSRHPQVRERILYIIIFSFLNFLSLDCGRN